MNLLILAIGLVMCLVLGIGLSYLTELGWLPASLLIFAVLHLHAALLTYAETRITRQTENHTRPVAAGKLEIIWFWLQTLGITLLAAGLGAYLQVNRYSALN